MQKQPAKKSYFFGQGYKDVGRAMKKTWSAAFRPVRYEARRMGMLFKTNLFAAIFALLCDLIVFTVITAVILLVNTVISAGLLLTCVVVAAVAYVLYSIVWFLDIVFCLFVGIASHCPTCQKKFLVPAYKCPKCGRKHTCLRPSTYGIWKRTCDCGTKIPTTFLNGRQKLQAFCVSCGTGIKDGGKHTEISIPVVGGPSAGKTCYVNMAITEIGKNAAKNGLVFSYSPVADDEYADNKAYMSKGQLPQKTNDLRMKYYQFYLTPKGQKTKILVSLCDVAGEVYKNSTELGKQIGYKHANAFLMLIDPLSVEKYRKELAKSVDVKKYGASEQPMDEVADALLTTLSDMNGGGAKELVKADVAVVFTKCDIPGLEDKIGAAAVRRYQQTNRASKYEAQNAVCEQFLVDYEEDNFLQTLKSRFKSIQFFTCSALGHEPNGKLFTPEGVEDPTLWLIDKASKSIDLKQKWGEKI